MRRALFFLFVAAAACAAPAGEDAEASEDEVRWEPVSSILGNPPNFAQASNGNLMSVVSGTDGRGAKPGALVELFYPKYAHDNLWDSYVGVRSGGKKLTWAHDLALRSQRMIPDSGIVETELGGGGLVVRIEDVVRPSSDVHLRRVIVVNAGASTLTDVDVAFYAFYTLGTLPGGDRIRFDRGALLQSDDDITVATLSDRAPIASHCGLALNPFGSRKDARKAAERNDLSPCEPTNAPATGVNGVLVERAGDLAPGASASVTYAISFAPDEGRAYDAAQRAISAGFDAVAAEDRGKWAAALARAKVPPRLPDNARAVYRRAIVTMLQHRVDNGAFIAAPTLTSPVYRFVWPRDGSKTAVDLLEAGYAKEAKDFFAFLEKLLLDDGSFAINYFPDGSRPFLNLGRALNENDQPGMLAWGVDRVLSATGDTAWAAARYPAVRRASEHLLAISGGGLVAPSRDLWELESGASWTYANASAVAGLEAAARLATALGHAADASRYEARARAIRDAMSARLVTNDGYFARGLDGTRIDTRLEIANLALGRGGFALLPDTDPRVAKIGDLVSSRLMTPGGAVRRYEGDRYYGGQPWPVASAWLALHRLARSDRAPAEALFRVMTEQAHATGSLMLGEQFDESEKRWVSAVPLVWSEAAYVRTALALY